MTTPPTPRTWDTKRARKRDRLAAADHLIDDGVVATEDAIALLEAVIRPDDRVALEGNNQKQADFLSRSLAAADPAGVHSPATFRS